MAGELASLLFFPDDRTSPLLSGQALGNRASRPCFNEGHGLSVPSQSERRTGTLAVFRSHSQNDRCSWFLSSYRYWPYFVPILYACTGDIHNALRQKQQWFQLVLRVLRTCVKFGMYVARHFLFNKDHVSCEFRKKQRRGPFTKGGDISPRNQGHLYWTRNQELKNNRTKGLKKGHP
jgi:hypothetical protein